MTAPSTPDTERSTTLETRKKIIRAAERLFAQDGFDRVTLRQIARASDQRNVAAVQYHFGSKTGLLTAIVDEHQAEIDEWRRDLFEKNQTRQRAEGIEMLFQMLIEPLARKLDSPSGRAYLRIQAQGFENEAMRPATRKIVSRIDRRLGRLAGSETAPYHSRFAVLLLFHALADRAHQEENGRVTRSDRLPFIRALSHSLIGFFRPPDAR